MDLSFLNMSPMVEKAYEIASKAHEGAKDKAGKDYISHPLTVARSLVDYGEKYVTAALLHDVVEDTDITIDDLKVFFPEDVITALSLLTHEEHPCKSFEEAMMNYHEYVRAIKNSGNDIAIKVKIADLTNNMDLSRIPNPTEKDFRRIEKKYKPAMEIMTKGE